MAVSLAENDFPQLLQWALFTPGRGLTNALESVLSGGSLLSVCEALSYILRIEKKYAIKEKLRYGFRRVMVVHGRLRQEDHSILPQQR